MNNKIISIFGGIGMIFAAASLSQNETIKTPAALKNPEASAKLEICPVIENSTVKPSSGSGNGGTGKRDNCGRSFNY